MDVLRAFVALEMPLAIQNALREISADLKEKLNGLPLRWLPVENIHLTLKFLGEISENSLDSISALLEAQANTIQPFEIRLAGTGVFPNARRPNVVWVGMDAPEDLLLLQQRIEMDLSRLGYPAEQRKFSPHLTLARVQRNAHPRDLEHIGDAIKLLKVVTSAAALVDKITLFSSELRSSGAVYHPLSQSRFAAAT